MTSNIIHLPSDCYDTILWAIVPSAFKGWDSFYNRLYKISYIVEAKFPNPHWEGLFRGIPYIVGASVAGYRENLVGVFDNYGRSTYIEGAIERFCKGIRKKHKNWSENKIQRSISNFQYSIVSQKTEFLANPIDYRLLIQLKVLCAFGSVVLFLDDGGMRSQNSGGTRGIPLIERMPKVTQGYTVNLEDESKLTEQKWKSIPYWIPVTYYANEFSREFLALNDSNKKKHITVSLSNN